MSNIYGEFNLISSLLDKMRIKSRILTDDDIAHIPNKITIKAMQEAESGKVTKCDSVDDMFTKL